MILDASLLNTQHYKVGVMSKLGQSKERSSALSLYLGVEVNEKGALGSLSTTVTNFTHFFLQLFWKQSFPSPRLVD